MKLLKIGLAGAAIAGFATAAYAVNDPVNAGGLVLHTTLSALTAAKTGIDVPVTDVRPGETFAITGDCVMLANPADNLRVVLTFTDARASVEPGFRSLLPTEQEFRDDSLHVRVPDMPEAANRVFTVKVFRLGQAAPEICDAGSIRIGSAASGKVG